MMEMRLIMFFLLFCKLSKDSLPIDGNQPRDGKTTCVVSSVPLLRVCVLEVQHCEDQITLLTNRLRTFWLVLTFTHNFNIKFEGKVSS